MVAKGREVGRTRMVAKEEMTNARWRPMGSGGEGTKMVTERWQVTRLRQKPKGGRGMMGPRWQPASHATYLTGL